MNRDIGLVSSEILTLLCDLVPSNVGRQSLIQSLISSFELDKKVDVIPVGECSEKDLTSFHTSEYVSCLLKRRPHDEVFVAINEKLKSFAGDDEDDSEASVSSDNEEKHDETPDKDFLGKFGLQYDCPLFPYMDKYVKYLASSTLSAANYIINHHKNDSSSRIIAMNWYGGRHHAKRSMASGFCYINDIVIGISHLRKHFKTVMYIDFDLHHGDGVEQAFKFSDKVLTFSIHRYDIGFFPGSGKLGDVGIGKGFNHSINLPMKKGLNDTNMIKIVQEILLPCVNSFSPECIVVQCGCDGLVGDENKEWNLTIKGFGDVIKIIMENVTVPTMFLGGGGYNNVDVAKCWTYLTNVIVNPDDQNQWHFIPEHEYLDKYEDCGFEFWRNTDANNMKDYNDKDYIAGLKKEILHRNND